MYQACVKVYFTVLVDEKVLSPNDEKGYILRLSHSFVRCNRSASMINSAYYDHLLAFKGRANLPDDESYISSYATGQFTKAQVELIEYVFCRLDSQAERTVA